MKRAHPNRDMSQFACARKRRAPIYRALIRDGDGKEKPGRLLRPDEVDDFLSMLNRFTRRNGVSARVVPLRVVPYKRRSTRRAH